MAAFVAAADAGAVAASGFHIAAFDGDYAGAALPAGAAADTGREAAGGGSDGPAVDGHVGFGMLTAADAGRISRAVGGDGSAVDHDGTGSFPGIATDAGARAATAGRVKRSSAANGHGRAVGDAQAGGLSGGQNVLAVQN